MLKTIRITLGKTRNFIGQMIYGWFKHNPSDIAASIRKKWLKTAAFIDIDVTIVNPRNISFGEGCAIYSGTYILNTHGNVTFGNRSHLGGLCYVNAHKGNLKIGDDVAVGPGTKIIVYSNHYEKRKKVTDSRLTGDITIGNNVFIGANCVMLPGTVIEDNVVVGAGSVIKGVLETNSVYAGIPCKLLKKEWF
jgi:acetyltransferase-like isoleucine patch superfamily enzyme